MAGYDTQTKSVNDLEEKHIERRKKCASLDSKADFITANKQHESNKNCNVSDNAIDEFDWSEADQNVVKKELVDKILITYMDQSTVTEGLN
ncbi:hypothetical protein DPMN_150706 [Dreissena polymorpha]|uniref:Uncharacterized protein n=1 Tax=Dreissena polymorpha TaxID=45954 RepID=A0A9D4FFU4_DREPO|nr:hypothetical protein DPMN_150706 [Dreissena polymorpha]